jgi:hypothetical protein
LPLPLLPPVIAIQASLDVAVQPHPAFAVTPTVPVPPLDVNDAVAEEME